jgi:hypothetical protein
VVLTPRSCGLVVGSLGSELGGSGVQLGLERLGGRGTQALDEHFVAGHGQRGPRGKRDVGGVDRAADLETLDVDLEAGRQVGRLGLDRQSGPLLVDEHVGRGVADERQRDVDGDLLAAADGDQVDVLERATNGVAHDDLRQSQLLALVGLQREQRVGVVLEREHELVARQREVAGLVAVAVEHGGHLAGTAGAAGRTLAELGAGLGDDADLGHGGTPRNDCKLWGADGAAEESSGSAPERG